MSKLTVSGVLVVALAVVPADAMDLYVNNGHASCSDSTSRVNNSATSPWCTIGRAAWGSSNRSSPNTNEAARAGDVVRVSAGTYTTTGTGIRYEPAYNPVNSGTNGNPITFEAVGVVVLRQSGQGPVVGSHGRNYITWRGFTIHEINALGTADTGPVVLWANTGSRIEDFVIDGYDAGAMGDNHNGIRLEYATDAVIRNNRIYNVLNHGAVHMNGAGIMAYFSDGAIIEHNEIYDCGSGIFIKGGDNANFVVRFNEVYETGHGILIQYTSTTGQHRIYQNIVRNSAFGISARLHSHNVWIVNNTSVNNGAGIHVIHWDSPISETRIYNNIVRQASDEVINGGNYHDLAELHLDRNNYYGSLRWSVDLTAYSSLASWRTALGGCPGNGNECGSITGDPMFVDFNNHDYRLQSASPARGVGIDVLDLNFNGSTTDTIPAGAYITGSETIGLISGGSPPSGPPAPPSGVRIIQ